MSNPLQVSGEILPQVEEFKCLGVLRERRNTRCDVASELRLTLINDHEILVLID